MVIVLLEVTCQNYYSISPILLISVHLRLAQDYEAFSKLFNLKPEIFNEELICQKQRR